MRNITACLAGLFVTHAAASDFIATTNPGIYALSGQRELQDSTTTSGKRDTGGSFALLQGGTLICARLGTSFGVQFTLAADAGIAALPVEVFIVHPAMRNQSGREQTEDQVDGALRPGRPHYYGWTFDDPAKLLAGAWRIVVSHGGAVLADQPFKVDFTCGKLVS